MYSSSPVTTGMLISRLAAASAGILRAETGSSYQKGLNSSIRRATRTACIGASRRWASTSRSTSGPTAARTAATLSTARVLLVFADIGSPGVGERVPLEGVESHLGCFDRAGGDRVRGLRLAGPAVGIDSYLVTAGAAEQVIDRRAELLADDIPECELDAAEGAIGVHRAAFDKKVVVHHVGEVLDVKWTAANEVLAHPIDVVRYGRFPVGLGVGLAPAGDAFVGIDSDEDEILCLAGGDQESE